MSLPSLTPDDLERYAWQLNCGGFGESGQRRLKGATVLVSRCGGVGGTIAQHLAMAGVGRLLIAHAGDLRTSDLNRQTLMRTDGIGQSRSELIARRLHELNPTIQVEVIPSNLDETNVGGLVAEADVVACAAPLFEERFAMNDACVRTGKPFMHAAMFDFEFQVALFHPHQTGCLRCLCPETPAWWRREFPVVGAVAGVAGAVAATEIIKLIAGVGEPLTGQMITGDLRHPHFRTLRLPRDPHCRICGPCTLLDRSPDCPR